MNTKPLVRAIACVALCCASAAWAGKTRNVILVIADGVRWQEVFTGADPTLLNGEAGGSWTSAEELKAKYWDDDPVVRRASCFRSCGRRSRRRARSSATSTRAAWRG